MAVTRTRARIIGASRELLGEAEGFSGFAVDAVARRAGVARMTVYHQFGSRAGLLEALYDALASAGGMQDLPGAFRRQDPVEGLAAFIGVFARFWGSDRLVLRRLQALAVLDPDFEVTLAARVEGRRRGLRVLVGRVAAERGLPTAAEVDGVVDALFALTSFPTFDMLAGPERAPADAAPAITRLAFCLLGVSA